MLRTDTTIKVATIKAGKEVKLPFNGSLANLRIFCKQCGDDSNLWDNPDEVSNLIIERAISFGLIQERSIN